MTSEHADLLHEWLGIAPSEGKPNHYRLLGIDLFEDGAKVIDGGVNKVTLAIKAHERSHQELVTELLSDVMKARACLLDKDTKAQYDNDLRNELKTHQRHGGETPLPGPTTVSTRLPVGPRAVSSRPPVSGVSAGDVQQQLHQLGQQIQAIAQKIPIHNATNILQKHNLFDGILEKIDEKFIKRLATAKLQKEALGKFLTRIDGSGGFPSLMTETPERRIFFESGSTIAYVVSQYVSSLISNAVYKHTGKALTNNLLALTALPGFLERVSPISGDLQTEYLGLFPSADIAPPSAESGSQDSIESWQIEAQGYQRLFFDCKSCTHLLTTCSNFSFLAGPLVGSRGNALAKHAIFSSRSPESTLALCFHFQKLIPLKRVGVKMQRPKPGCYVVFPLPASVKSVLNFGSLGDENWHNTSWMNGGNCCAKKLQDESVHTDFPLIDFQFDKAWVQLAEQMRILIALPDENWRKALEILNDEIKHANKSLTKLKREYSIVNESMLKQHHYVAEIEMRSTQRRL